MLFETWPSPVSQTVIREQTRVMFLVLGYIACVFILYKLLTLIPRPKTPLYKKYATESSWCLITGCTDGIGQAMAVYLAKKKWNLILVGRNATKLDTLVKELSAFGVELKTVQVDLSDDLTLENDIITSHHIRISDAIQSVPQLNMLINNAGVSHEFPNEFSKEPLHKLKQIINVNILGVVVVTKLALPKLKGCIINMGSFSGLLPSPLLSVYSGSKVFVQYLGDCLAIEEKIDIYHLDTYFVSTKMSKMKPNWMCPTAEAFAASVMQGNLSCKTNSGYTGYWSHSFLKWGLTTLFTTGFWMDQIYKLHLGIQKRALRKQKNK